MKKIKRMACLLPLFGGILGGCAAASGPPGDEPFSADDAIAKVIRQEQCIHFPETEGKIEGIIHGGGPDPGMRVPGTFASAAKKRSGAVYVVMLTETWNAKDFRPEGAPAEGNLSYSWEYEVSPAGVKLVSEGGDFPPDHVE
ncbi:hypothetical protein [Paenibacillus cookii]|nr:hypothetical protein [Paenibacillus cookii]